MRSRVPAAEVEKGWQGEARPYNRTGDHVPALLLVDVIKDFEHEDGERLLNSFRQRHRALAEVVEGARDAGMTIAYANDSDGRFDSDASGLVECALHGKGGELVSAIVPRPEDLLVLKRHYSAFDETPLASFLEERGIEGVIVAGTATERCVFQTACDALRLGLDVTVRADACATVDERHEALALDYLEQVLEVRVLGRD
jgi:nicotinamidase-related amidase